MNKIILIIILIVIIILLIYVFNKDNDKLNKVLFFLVQLTIIGTLLFLIFFPGKKWNNENYFMGIAQMVGGLFTVIGVYFTIKEEEKMRKIDEMNAENKIKEQLRLANLPVLKFESDNEKESNSGSVYFVECESNGDNLKIQLNIKIKNVGLGSAQNIFFQEIIGIKNDGSTNGITNQILEPKEVISHTIYFELPKIESHLYKRLTILMFYEDLLGNKYMQKLDGYITCQKGEKDSNYEYSASASVSSDDNYIRIGQDYKYEIPQEVIDEEIDRINYEEKEKRFIKEFPEKKQIDKLADDYLNTQKSFYDICNDFFNRHNFQTGWGDYEDYKLLGKNIYMVKIAEQIETGGKEYIKCVTTLRVNIKTEEVRSLNKEIVESNLKVSHRLLKKFKKLIRKELKNIKNLENIIYN